MNALFSLSGALALEQLRTGNSVLAFDLDGTLAPLTANRAQAAVPLSTASRMNALMRDWPVAVITGRAVNDASARLNFTPHYLLGNHGAEFGGAAKRQMASFANMTDSKAAACLDHCRNYLAVWEPQFLEQGVQVEDKGLSIAIHYREAYFVSATERWLRSILAVDNTGLSGEEDWQSMSVTWGHRVVNIVPSAAPDKGQALLEIMRDCGASTALMVGDDVNDETAFAALPAGSVGVRVGATSKLDELFDESATAAHFALSGQAMVEPFLDLLLSLRR